MQNLNMRLRSKFLSTVILAALVLVAAGCSTLRLGYANGDTFAYWWMNSYVDFNDEQKPWVKDEIGKFFAWHRQTQLPDYAQALARARQRLGEPVSAAEVDAEFALLRERVERAVDYALPQLATLALSLTPQQIASIERKFASNNEKYRKEHLRGTAKERLQARYEKVMKHAEYWFGSFDAAQLQQIRAISDARPMDHELWFAERRQRQQELLRILKRVQAERPPREEVERLLRAYTKAVLQNVTYAQHKSFFDASRQAMAQMTAQIINLASPAQKAHARRRLERLIEDGYALAGTRAAQQLSMQLD